MSDSSKPPPPTSDPQTSSSETDDASSASETSSSEPHPQTPNFVNQAQRDKSKAAEERREQEFNAEMERLRSARAEYEAKLAELGERDDDDGDSEPPPPPVKRVRGDTATERMRQAQLANPKFLERLKRQLIAQHKRRPKVDWWRFAHRAPRALIVEIFGAGAWDEAPPAARGERAPPKLPPLPTSKQRKAAARALGTVEERGKRRRAATRRAIAQRKREREAFKQAKAAK